MLSFKQISLHITPSAAVEGFLIPPNISIIHTCKCAQTTHHQPTRSAHTLSHALSLTLRSPSSRACCCFPFLKILRDMPTDISDPMSLLLSPACCCFRQASEAGDLVSDTCSDLISAPRDRLAPQLSLTSKSF